MKMVKLSDSLAVSAQISPADVQEIAAAGYRVLVNNRPDGEESGQPAGAEIAAVAESHGLAYFYMPVTHSAFPGDDFAAFSELLDDPTRPVFAFCRSGTRCANLWVVSCAPDEHRAAAAQARTQGFDLGMAADHLGEALQ